MGKDKENIWFAIVGVKPLAGNEIIPKAIAAHVNVALVSKNKTTFKKTLKENFHHHKFEILEILDIETEDTLTIENSKTSEKLKLLKEIKEGYRFAGGTFFWTKTK